MPGLARYLRLLGFDAVWGHEWADERLAAYSARERRFLLTRDRGLLKRKIVTHGLLLRSDDPRRQVLEVLTRLQLASGVKPLSRCMACNGLLSLADKDSIKQIVPPGVASRFDSYRKCGGCGRVYWEGTHHTRLVELVSSLCETASSGVEQGGGAWP